VLGAVATGIRLNVTPRFTAVAKPSWRCSATHPSSGSGFNA